MPVEVGARATVNEPTAVSAAPAPWVRVSVAPVPLVDTEERESALGTFASVHGDVAVDAARVSEKVAVTRLILPSVSVSSICNTVSAGAALSVGVAELNVAALLPAAS